MAEERQAVAEPVAPAAPATVLEVRDLRVRYDTARRSVHAVNGVSFELREGEIFGLVGESGCGKSVTLRSLIGLLPAGHASVRGSARYGGDDMLAMSERRLRALRGAEISMIFQDPMTSLNPVTTIGEQITETLARHTDLDRRARRERALELMRLVGIPAAERRLRQFPHQFSGGMRQRVLIAIALACGPRVLLADEPTTALDVTIQDQILRLIKDLRARLGMSVVLVSHDLGVIVQTCDRVAVMYGGQIVETAPARELLRSPRHPYTIGLVRSLPRPSAVGGMLDAIPGSPPSLSEPPVRCTFRPRCPASDDGCEAWPTELIDLGGGRLTRCRRHDRLEARNG